MFPPSHALPPTSFLNRRHIYTMQQEGESKEITGEIDARLKVLGIKSIVPAAASVRA